MKRIQPPSPPNREPFIWTQLGVVIAVVSLAIGFVQWRYPLKERAEPEYWTEKSIIRKADGIRGLTRVYVSNLSKIAATNIVFVVEDPTATIALEGHFEPHVQRDNKHCIFSIDRLAAGETIVVEVSAAIRIYDATPNIVAARFDEGSMRCCHGKCKDTMTVEEVAPVILHLQAKR